jgi:hypothetical protein
MRRAAMRLVAMAAGVVLLASSQWGQAAAIINIDQVGSNVVATGAGTIDLTDLHATGGGNDYSVIDASNGNIVVGPSAGGGVIIYSGITGPTSFGSGPLKFADSGTGDLFGVDFSILELPFLYTSGDPLNGSATFLNRSFSTLGLTPGTYTYTWGTPTDGHADSLTVQIGPAATAPVPLPSSLAGGSVLLAMAGMLARRRPSRPA